MDIESMIEILERGRKLYMLNDENLIELIKSENELQNYLSDSVDAIDEAIACHSVTSEDVQEAIEVLECIYPSQKEIVTGEYPQVADALDLAIIALQAYQPWVGDDQ
jgi:hypothetical protein